MLFLRIAATNPVAGLEEQTHCLYSETITLAQRRDLFTAANGQQINLDLIRQGSDDEITWKAWARVESAKRLVVCLLMLDSFYANILDTPPIIRVAPIGFSIPCCNELFEAPNARKWSQLGSAGAPIVTAVATLEALPGTALDSELAMQGYLASLWIRLSEARHRLLQPTRLQHNNTSIDSPSLIPLPTYALDPSASIIAPLLSSIPPVSYTHLTLPTKRIV